MSCPACRAVEEKLPPLACYLDGFALGTLGIAVEGLKDSWSGAPAPTPSEAMALVLGSFCEKCQVELKDRAKYMLEAATLTAKQHEQHLRRP